MLSTPPTSKSVDDEANVKSPPQSSWRGAFSMSPSPAGPPPRATSLEDALDELEGKDRSLGSIDEGASSGTGSASMGSSNKSRAMLRDSGKKKKKTFITIC